MSTTPRHYPDSNEDERVLHKLDYAQVTQQASRTAV